MQVCHVGIWLFVRGMRLLHNDLRIGVGMCAENVKN